jgi:D-glycero-D-manno-heptose 1,7-bisphosphate phosphatase
MLIEAKKKWNISFKKSYLVGDRDKDIKAGKKAGVKTIFFSSKIDQKKNKIKCNFKINSLKEIYKIIK